MRCLAHQQFVSKRRAFAAALLSLVPLALGRGLSARAGQPDQGRVQHVAHRRGRAQRQAVAGRVGDLARRRQCQGRLARPPGANWSTTTTRAIHRTCPAIYTKLISVDKVDLILGPYATNMVAPAMPIIMQNKKTTISMLAIGINRHFNYPKYFSMVPTRAGRRAGVLAGILRACGRAEPETQDGGVARGRRRVRPHGGGRREGECQGARLRHRLRPRLSAADNRLLARRAGPAGGQRRSSCSSPPIRPIRSASCARRTRSGSRRKSSAAR